MKLRIRGNSIRLRLTQSEVTRLTAEGRVEDAVSFGGDEEQLKYALSRSGDGGDLTSTFQNNQITIFVPAAVVNEWANSEQVGIEGSQTVRDGELHILIEKDFACLKPRHGQEDADTFANPLAAEHG